MMSVLSRRWGFAAERVILPALLLVVLSCQCGTAAAGVVVSRPPNPAGGLIPSSWVDPEGSDSDQYAYDSFVLSADQSITEVHWRGGYIYNATLPNGERDMVRDFRITFYASVTGDFQPLCGNPHMTETVFLADEWTGSNAGETPVGTFGGKALYDYRFVLATPFAATAGVKYWIKIEGSQGLFPDWGIAVGTGENSSHFHFDSGNMRFSYRTGDTAFTLMAPGPDPYTVMDIVRALSLWAGIADAGAGDVTRLNVETEGASADVIDCCDAIRLARKTAGLEANP